MKTIKQTNQEKTQNVKTIINQARSTIVSVTFKKKDGSLRGISFNGGYRAGIKGDSASESAKKAVATRKENNPNIINVIDFSIDRKNKINGENENPWRSFDCESVVAIKSGGETYVW